MNIDKLFFAFLKWSFIYFCITVVIPVSIKYATYKALDKAKLPKDKRYYPPIKSKRTLSKTSGKSPVKYKA